MASDLFISYAWTSSEHRQWVRLLAAQLKALGYGVLIDADLDYGDALTGFMRQVVETGHVLMVVDENYVDRADTLPGSGVGVENHWLAAVYGDRPATWLSVLFKDNPEYRLPWLTAHEPKGHSFNADPSAGDFPGSEQIEELWRWVEGLPANRDNATSVATLRRRAAHLERHQLKSEPSRWRSPSLTGEAHFTFLDATDKTYRWGYRQAEFALRVSGCGDRSVYVYRDPIRAVGVVRAQYAPPSDLEAHLSPGRSVIAEEGETVVLMNEHGALCRVEIVKVQRESTGTTYIAPYLDFRWEVVGQP